MPPDYDDGWQTGYTQGAYGVRPQGGWDAVGYSDPRSITSPDYREGMQHGRTDRITEMGDQIYNPDALNAEAFEAFEAWQVYQQQTGA